MTVPRQKPFRGSLINPAHPLSRGLIRAYVLNEHVGEIWEPFQKLLSTDNTASWVADGLNYDGSSQYTDCGSYIYPPDYDMDNKGLTIFLGYKGTDAGGIRRGLTVQGYGGHSWGSFGLFLVTGGKALMSAYSPPNSAYRQATSTSAINDGSHHTVAGVVNPSANKVYVYADGVNEANDDWLDTDAFQTSESFYRSLFLGCMENESGKRYVSGTIEFVFIWKRFLLDEEIKALHANPYAMFDRPSPVRHFYVAAGGAIYEVTAADGVSMGESVNRSADFSASISDGLAAGESLGRVMETDQAASDGVTLAETLARVISAARTASDGLVAGDAPSVQIDFQGVAIDGLALSDALAAAAVYVIAVSDGLTAGDTTTLGSILDALAADGVTLAETLARTMTAGRSAADGVTLSDTGAARAVINVTVSDSASLADALAVITDFTAVAADGVTISDLALSIIAGAGARLTFTVQARAQSFTAAGRAFSLTAEEKAYHFITKP